MSHDNCELILVDVYWTKGSVYTDTNHFQSCYESFQAEYAWLQKAIQKDLVQLPNIREVFALGGLGKHSCSNSSQSLPIWKERDTCIEEHHVGVYELVETLAVS